jgi:hypothetical protein
MTRPARRGLPLFHLNGTPGSPIVITGPESGQRPVLLGRDTHNTIRLSNASHLVIRRLEVDGRGRAGFGVATQGAAHHITIEDNYFQGLDGDQQIVAISTTGQPTWNWIIRRNVIAGAGTGMYLGNSNGDSPFVAGLIEHNVIRDTIGYNIQVKHQTAWDTVPAGMPTDQTTTVIRHNVFSKSTNSSTAANARPNLLVGDVPPSGPGATNGYAIYGNFFYQNPSESLFQGEGNIAFYSNVLVTDGSAVRVQTHNGSVRDVRIFNNTVVAGGSGISVSGGAAGYAQRVSGNAVFAAGTAISLSGSHATASQNVADTRDNASLYLNNPTATLGALDLYPKTTPLQQGALDMSGLDAFPDWDHDFNCARRHSRSRGAYSGYENNAGWRVGLTVKPDCPLRARRDRTIRRH